MEIKTNELYFAVDDGGTIPTKRDEDGWYDVYAKRTEDAVYVIPCLTTKLIPTGLHTACSSKYRMSIGERGSNTKSGLMTMAGKIDSGFTGEWFVALYNASNDKIKFICTKEKFDEWKLNNYFPAFDDVYQWVDINKAIAQFAVEEVPVMDVKTCTVDEILNRVTERGTGALGSSNK